MFTFLLGLVIGGVVGWLFYVSAQRENARVEEEKAMLLQEKQIVLRFMHDLVEAIGRGGTREELLNYVVHAAINTTGAISACVFELTEDKLLKGSVAEGLFPPLKRVKVPKNYKTETRAGFIARVMRPDTFALGEGVIGSVADSHRGELIADAKHDPRIVECDDETLAVHTLIVVPIAFRGKLIGVLAVANQNDNLPFNETDYSLVDSLAEQAALAIHNLDAMQLQIEKSRIDQDLALANTIQGMLLPHAFPADGRLDISAIFLPAQMVGGDLYDVVELQDGRIGIAVADVSGKGIPASLLMAICQSNLRHFARAIDSPGKVLAALNAVILEETQRHMFVTMIYAIIDPNENKITLARAGHEQPILLTAKDSNGVYTPTMLDTQGMALGMVPPAIFDGLIEETSVTYNNGDILVLYTDGLTETRNSNGEEFSANRLADAVRINRKKTANDINDAILEQMNEFGESDQQHDDITLLTIKLFV